MVQLAVDLAVDLAEAMARLPAHAYAHDRRLSDVAAESSRTSCAWTPTAGNDRQQHRGVESVSLGEETSVTTVSAERLATVFVEIADTLVDDFDLIDFLHTVTSRTAELTEASAAGLLLADYQGRLQFMAASEESAKLLELFQVQHHEGPCQDAYRKGVPVINADLAGADDRWPLFAPRAVASGFRSVHALPLRCRREVIGALNLFGTDVGRLAPADVRVVQALADVATIGLLQERAIHRGEILSEQLQGALNSRVIIEQAKGAIAQSHGVSVDEAFELLRTYCRRRHLRLGETARAILTDDSVTDLTAP